VLKHDMLSGSVGLPYVVDFAYSTN